MEICNEDIENKLKEYFLKTENINLKFWNTYYNYILELLILKLVEQKDFIFDFNKHNSKIKKICNFVVFEFLIKEKEEEKKKDGRKIEQRKRKYKNVVK
jgi:hypothetical protein